jgi:hypothetical protein
MRGGGWPGSRRGRRPLLAPGQPGATDDSALAPFTGSLDVMGDGSLVLLATPGHTAGSVSLLIRRTARPPLLLAGDLTYGADILRRGQVPGVGHRHVLAESTRKVLALQQQHRAWSCCRPRPNRRPAGCWTANTERSRCDLPQQRHARRLPRRASGHRLCRTRPAPVKEQIGPSTPAAASCWSRQPAGPSNRWHATTGSWVMG